MQDEHSTRRTIWMFLMLPIVYLPDMLVGGLAGAAITRPGLQVIPFMLAGAWGQDRLLAR